MIKRLTKQTIEARFEYNARSDWEQWILLCSDIHFDNPKCDRRLFFSHMDEAKERNALVFVDGDFFCLMNGRYDPRRSKTGIRKEYNEDNYLDLVINDAAERMKPYAGNILGIAHGNHEQTVSLNCNTSVLDRLVERINIFEKTSIQVAPYQGLIMFRFVQPDGGAVKTIRMFFHHGKWGGVITKGTLGVGRYATIFPEADIVLSGHTHDQWIVKQPQFRVNKMGEWSVKNQYHIKTGTYKEEYLEGDTWANKNIVMPKCLGGYWLRFRYSKPKGVHFDIFEAN